MSSTSHDTTAKKRVLEILRILIENPGHYTRKKLAELYSISPDTISRDFESIKNAGFDLTTEKSIYNKLF
jgi:predicted DNA-binding transcriptional regulator YafY